MANLAKILIMTTVMIAGLSLAGEITAGGGPARDAAIEQRIA